MQQPTGLAGLGIGSGSSRDLLRRTSSRSSMQRSESAPLLTPLWEPQQEPDYDHLQPTWTNTSLSLDHDREWLESQCPFDRERESYHNLNDLCALPTSWQRVLSTMAAESTRHAPVSQSEMLGAAQESLHDALPLSFEYGLVDHSYILKKELVAEANFKVPNQALGALPATFCLS
uniref:Uncharacterized protein n=1 Tax=Chrysotila carterae TaxID=13221 RepID=A0A7S4C3R5_CHRCT